MFILQDPDNNWGSGKTLKEAYEDYENYHGADYQADECTWYEAEEIEVRTKIEKVEQVTIKQVKSK